MESYGDRLKRPVTEADWTRGPADAPVTLLEYIDFQCPCCQGSYRAIEELVAQFGDRLRYAVREFPVSSIHRFAEGAARTAEAAGRQGKFWEMYHVLIQARGQLDREHLDFYARELSLDMDRFHEDMKGEAVLRKLAEDKYWGLRSGVNGTPTLYINRARYDEAACPVQEEELREAIEEMIAARA